MVSVDKGSGTNKSCPLEAAKSTSRCSMANLTTRLAGDQKSGELTTKELRAERFLFWAIWHFIYHVPRGPCSTMCYCVTVLRPGE